MNNRTGGGQTLPGLAYDDAGRILFQWTGPAPENNLAIRSRIQSQDGELTDDERLASRGRDGTGEADAEVAATLDGGFAMVWQAFAQNYDTVQLRLFDHDGRPVGRLRRVTTGFQRHSSARLAVLANGNIAVVWEDNGFDYSHYRTMIRVYGPTGVPLTDAFRATESEGRSNIPHVAAAGDGTFLVAWSAPVPSLDGGHVYARRFSAEGNALGRKFRLSIRRGPNDRPWIAPATDGGFLAVWQSSAHAGDDYAEIYARRFDGNDRPVGGEFRVNTFIPGGQFVPAAVADGVGGFIAVWTSVYSVSIVPGQDGHGGGVFGRRVDDGGRPAGLEFQVNAYTADDQGWLVWPAGIASRGDGEIAVTWQSQDQDSSDWGVFAQRFEVSPGAGPLCGDAHAQDLLLETSDALQVLRSGLGLRECLACVCDVNGSGAVTASDALLTLRDVVGAGAGQCPSCVAGEESPAGAGALQ